jgi:hypothetical protein
MADGRFVSYDRWDEAHKSLVLRVLALERFADRLTGAEQVHAQLAGRITALEQEAESRHEHEQGRRERTWVVALSVISGVVFPVVVTSVIAFLHLHG